MQTKSADAFRLTVFCSISCFSHMVRVVFFVKRECGLVSVSAVVTSCVLTSRGFFIVLEQIVLLILYYSR